MKGPDYPSETFRELMEKEIRRHGEYRTRRLVLAAWDRMEADGTFEALGMAAEADPPFPAGAMTAFSIAPIRNTLASSNPATSSSSTQSKFRIL